MIKQVDNFTYNTANVIGSGTSSVVYLGNSVINNEVVAIRVIDLKKLIPETMCNLQHEMIVLNYLPSHPNIVKLHCILKTENRVYMVTEYCEEKLEINGGYDVEYVAAGIIEGLKHLIKNNVVHRDLKPENIMLKNGVPKIIDFGFARKLANMNQTMFEYLGTPFYMAPQVLQHKLYNSKSDIWSLGALLYHILFKKIPFDATTTDHLIRKIKTTAPHIPSGYSTILQTLIQGCLIIDQVQRYSWQQVFALASQLNKRSVVNQNIKPYVIPFAKRPSIQISRPGIALLSLHNVQIGYGF